MSQKTSLKDIEIQFEQAKKLHQKNVLIEASVIYEAILKAEPRHADAMHLLGLVAVQNGQYELGISWIEKAICIEPCNAKFHSNLGAAFVDTHQHLKALSSYDRAIAIDPSFIDAHYNKAVSQIALNHWQDAVQSLEQALLYRPLCFEALYLLGNALQELRRFKESIARYRQAESINSRYAPLFFNLANALKALGNMEEAIKNYEESLKIDQAFMDAYINLGNALKESDQTDRAITVYQKAIAVNPCFHKAHFNLGNAYKHCQKYELAVKSYDAAIRINDQYQEAYLNKGAALVELLLLEDALQSYSAAIKLKTDDALAYFNCANTLAKLFKFEEAIQNYGQAIHYKRDYYEAHFNMGNVFLELGNPSKAIENYDFAIALNPQYEEAIWNKSNALLLAGKYESGWKLYEIRRRENQAVPPRSFEQSVWLGKESIAGKTILIHAEQGLGDTLQFIRYVPKLADLGARVLLEVQPQLLSLLQTVKGISLLVKKGDDLPAFDFHCPIMSLPLAFGTNSTTRIPAPINLMVCEKKKFFWVNKLVKRNKLQVGLVWSGGFRPDQQEFWEINGRRNLPLHYLKTLKGIGVEFISLQKGEPAESEFRQAVAAGWDGPVIHDHVNELKDFSDTAALVMNLDLVIAVDTSTAHLAATLGKPVWLLNRFDTCWRWLLDREDSPWYPSIKIYRQPAHGNWENVMQRVRADLMVLAASHSKAC